MVPEDSNGTRNGLIEDSNGTRNGSDRGLKWYRRTQMVPGMVLIEHSNGTSNGSDRGLKWYQELF